MITNINKSNSPKAYLSNESSFIEIGAQEDSGYRSKIGATLLGDAAGLFYILLLADVNLTYKQIKHLNWQQ